MFAFVTTPEETLRADIRRARVWADSPSGVDALEGAAFLAERIGATDVRNMLLAAIRHPDRRELLLEMAQRMMASDPCQDEEPPTPML